MVDWEYHHLRKILTLVIYLAALAIHGCKTKEAVRIRLTSDMLINEVAKGDASRLIDEQGTREGFPVHFPQTRWSLEVPVGKPDWYLPANAVIELKRDHVITDIFVFHGDGPSGKYQVNYGIPFKWTLLVSDSTADKAKWTHLEANITTRYLQISRDTDSDLREVILYGYPVGDNAEKQVTRQERQAITLDKAIGINSHHLDPFNRVVVAGIAREYHNWILNEGGFTHNYQGYPHNQVQWNPGSPRQAENEEIPKWDPRTPGGHDFDAYYKELKGAGITVFPCIQGTVPWVSGEPNTKSRHKPVTAGKDPSDPFSYVEHADFMFQYAARYGKRVLVDSLLKAAPGQVKRSGLNYLEYYENWNEPDGWWGGRRDYFTPYEYAAMSSSDYDGHESRMGKDKGIKNADPEAKLVMSGIAIPNVDYLRAMKFWFDHNRTDRRFVFDVITVHHYCNAKGSQAVMTEGISPEEDGLQDIVRKIADFRDAHFPDREVWLTEFGWDTNPETPQSAPSRQTQGQWLVRAFLESFAGGMDRVMMYMLRDVDPKSHVQFSSSGLIGPPGDFSPKPSWYYVYTLRNQLTGCVFDRELQTTNELVRAYRFRDPNGERSVLVLWCPKDGDVVRDYELDVVAPGAGSCAVVSLREGETNGLSRNVRAVGGKIKADISPSPIFVTIQEKD